MAFCRQCGSKLFDNMPFCGNCGQRVFVEKDDMASVSESEGGKTEVIDTGREGNLNRSQPTYVGGTDVSVNRNMSSAERNLSGSTVDGKYNLISLMSSGGESDLYVCSAPDGQKYCMKLYHDFQHVRIDVRDVLMTLHHENILGLIGWGHWQDMFYEVTPLFNGRNLDEMVKDDSIRKYDLKLLIEQMAEAVHKLHSVGIIHQDIKPANFMVSETGKVKLIDFGISGLLEKSDSPEDPGRTHLTKIGETSDFASPQVLGNRDSFVGSADDIFSLGATIYYMIFKRSCYVRISNTGAIDWASVVNNRIPELDKLSLKLPVTLNRQAEQYRHLLFGLLQYDPGKRWPYEAITDWIRGDYSKWIIKPPKVSDGKNSAVYTLFEGGSDTKFIIPDEIPQLVTTLAYKWKIDLLESSGRFRLLAGVVEKIGGTDEYVQKEKARLWPICNASWDDMKKGSMRAYSYIDYIHPDKNGLYFIKLYQLYPELRVFAWMGHVSKDLSELGQNMLQVLWQAEINGITAVSDIDSSGYDFGSAAAYRQKKDDSKTEPLTFELLFDIVQYHLVSIYYFLHGNEELSEQAYKIEDSVSSTEEKIQEGYYELAYLLSGSKELDLGGDLHFVGLPEFKNHVNSIISKCSAENKNDSFCAFVELLYANGSIKPGFRVWARRQGIEKYVDELQGKLKEIYGIKT